ncbi:hypothetical protein P4220_00060 [Pseudomonas aeruginosa]|nr:hypothetical protein [Pseudomonas aeruginosa]
MAAGTDYGLKIIATGVTVGVFPPVYLQQLAEHAERDGNPPPVRVYCFGGDAVAQASYDLGWRALSRSTCSTATARPRRW